MFPASTHNGQAVTAFPDVCKTPGSGRASMIPTPLPNIGATRKIGGGKTKFATKTAPTKTATSKTGGDAPGLRIQMGILHRKLMAMPAGNATGWHKVLDEYVMTSAELYKSLSGR